MFYEEHRKPTKIEDMSPYITQAIVASEDTRFYEHNGVDAKGVARAFVANQQAGGVSQGASTLTMQYVRMALRDGAQTPEGGARGHRADHRPQAARDAAGHRAGEADLASRRSSQRYLNSAYFGHRAYGIFAASEVFFSKTPQGPRPRPRRRCWPGWSRRRPRTTRRAKDQRGGHRAAQLRDRPDAQDGLDHRRPGGRRPRKPKIKLKLTTPPNDCVSVAEKHNDWGFFCDYFTDVVDGAAGLRHERRRSARRTCAAAATRWSPRSTRRSRRRR